jgi:hypothetical protein
MTEQRKPFNPWDKESWRENVARRAKGEVREVGKGPIEARMEGLRDELRREWEQFTPTQQKILKGLGVATATVGGTIVAASVSISIHDALTAGQLGAAVPAARTAIEAGAPWYDRAVGFVLEKARQTPGWYVDGLACGVRVARVTVFQTYEEISLLHDTIKGAITWAPIGAGAGAAAASQIRGALASGKKGEQEG